MRPEVQELLAQRDWPQLRHLEDGIVGNDSPRELRALALSLFYTGSVGRALVYFRSCVDRLSGRERAAALVDGACALSLMGDYDDALAWLDRYDALLEKPYEGPALECRAYCLWQQGQPWKAVDEAYQLAITAFAGSDFRIARLTVDRVQMLIQHGHYDLAEAYLASIAMRSDVSGHVMGCHARLLAARGQEKAAREVAIEAIGLLHSTVDPLGNNLREICRLYLLLGSITTRPERLVYTAAAKAAATTLRCAPMYEEACLIERR